MSRRVLAQAGHSLADLYDVEGSSIDIEALDNDEVKLVHDLSGTIHAERLHANLNVMDSTAQAQNLSWDVELVGFRANVPQRLLGISVLANTAARVTRASISLADNSTNAPEIILWAWDIADDAEVSTLWSDNGAAVAVFFLLSPLGYVSVLPTLLVRLGVAAGMPSIFFRGSTEAFGAGTVRTRAILHFARPLPPLVAAGDPSSAGLPLPSW